MQSVPRFLTILYSENTHFLTLWFHTKCYLLTLFVPQTTNCALVTTHVRQMPICGLNEICAVNSFVELLKSNLPMISCIVLSTSCTLYSLFPEWTAKSAKGSNADKVVFRPHGVTRLSAHFSIIFLIPYYPLGHMFYTNANLFHKIFHWVKRFLTRKHNKLIYVYQIK